MSAQPEALRLANELDADRNWLVARGLNQQSMAEAAAELRRLSAIEAQRDEMLEALKLYVFWRGYRDEHDTLLPPEMQLSEIAQAMRLISKAEGQ